MLEKENGVKISDLKYLTSYLKVNGKHVLVRYLKVRYIRAGKSAS